MIYVLCEVTTHVERGLDVLELGQARQVVEVGVVGDLKVGTDVGEGSERNILQALVVVDDESSVDLGQVRGGQALEVVALEDTEVSGVDLGERGDVERADGAEGDVVRRLKQGERHVHHGVVEGKGQEVGDVCHVGEVDGIDLVVVGDEDVSRLVQVDTIQVLEFGVLDVEMIALGDTGCEFQAAQVGETLEDEGIDLLQLWERQSSELGNVVERELAGDGLQTGAPETLDVGVALDDQVTLDRLDATKIDVVAHTGGNGNAAGVGCAAGDGSGIAAVLDGCSCRVTAGGWRRESVGGGFGCGWGSGGAHHRQSQPLPGQAEQL